MSAKREVCRRKEISLSQQNVAESPRMEESWCEGCVVGIEGKHLERVAVYIYRYIYIYIYYINTDEKK